MPTKKRRRRSVDDIMRRPAVQLARAEALPCPFCGKQPHIQGWHGGGRDKRLIDCQNDQCVASPMVTGSSRLRAIRNWNTRAWP